MNYITICREKIHEYYKNNRKSVISKIILAILLILGVIFVYNDYFLYDYVDIAKITSVKNSYTQTKENGEKYYKQDIEARIMNGQHKGEEINLSNTYTTSRIYDDRYRKGDSVFIDLSNSTDTQLVGTIKSMKRDTYVAILFSIFAIISVCVASRKGLFAIITLCVNIFIFSYGLNEYINGHNILDISIILVVFYTIFSLMFISGVNKKTISAIISTLISVIVIMILVKIVLRITEVDYAFMEYILSPDDLPEIFLSEILLGGLGAIMDVSISMSTAMDELVTKESNISYKALRASGREIGYDIMGTMVNILLFTFFCGSIPMIILKMKNDMSLLTILSLHMDFELYRFLIGGIGIIVSIPIAQYISIFIIKKGSKK